MVHYHFLARNLDCQKAKDDTREKCDLDKIQKAIDNGWYVTIAVVSPKWRYLGGVQFQSGKIITFRDGTRIQVE